MSVQRILDYVRARGRAPDDGTIGEIYGTENFCVFLYSLLRMEQPEVVVELGVGAGVTTLLAAQALRENGRGHVWAVDDGSDWDGVPTRPRLQEALGYADEQEDYAGFLRRLLARFELGEVVTHVALRTAADQFFAPPEKIGVVFADAPPSDAEGCVALLRYYLPRMRPYSSIFIDRASTLNHAYLLLNHVVEQLDRGKIPLHLLAGLGDEQEDDLRHLVAHSRFSIVHLTETRHGKRHWKQNSRAWLRIEPNDYLPHNDVISFV